VAYQTGSGKSKGLRTIYQQQIRYMQFRNITGTPQQLFDEDLLHQCKLLRKSGERIILLMDANEHVLTGKFNREIVRTGLDLKEFTHNVGERISLINTSTDSYPLMGATNHQK
jgi:hypothetical protein